MNKLSLRLVSLLLALCLLPAAVLADEAAQPDLIWLVDSASGRPLVSGVFVQQPWGNMAVFPLSALPSDVGAMVGRTGSERLSVLGRIDMEEAGLVYVVCEDGKKAYAPAAASTGTPAVCRGLRADGAVVTIPVTRQHALTLDGTEGVLFTAAEGLLPGALLLDKDGGLVGLTVSSWGEGRGQYYAVSASAIVLADEQPVALEGRFATAEAEITAERGLLRIEFPSLVSTLGEGDNISVLAVDPANGYRTYYIWHNEEEDGEPYCNFAGVPGRSYDVWVYVGPELPPASALDPAESRHVDIPAAKKLDRYSYRDENVWIAAVPVGTSVGETEELPPAETSTGLLFGEDREIYLQVTSHYEVTEEVEEILLIALYAPDGQCFAYLGGFLYMPSIMGMDVWHCDITELFEDCGRFADAVTGDYRLAYYYDGDLVGEITFTVTEEEGEPSPAPEQPAEVTEPAAEDALQVSWDAGILTVDFTALKDQGPLTVYVQDGGNSFFTRSTPWEGDEKDSPVRKFIGVPGRSYDIWAENARGEIAETSFAVPDAEKLDRYSYTDEDVFVTAVPEGTEVTGTERLPEHELTEEVLFGGGWAIYLQVTSHYAVEEEVRESLLIVLTTPDGMCIAEYAGFIYGPDFMDNDVWNGEITELFRSYAQYGAGISSGTYLVSYYIGGDLAGAASFTIGEAAV